jgi:hypothetical protein
MSKYVDLVPSNHTEIILGVSVHQLTPRLTIWPGWTDNAQTCDSVINSPVERFAKLVLFICWLVGVSIVSP